MNAAHLSKRRAAKARLVYVNEFDGGITRRRRGRGFSYISSNGNPITAERTKRRIEGLVIPPAWEDVWICPKPSGHIQARGRDEAGRLQYIYHERWESIRSVTKFDRMHLMGQVLPRIRRRVRKDLNRKIVDKSFVVAAVVRLMDKAQVRVGNDKSAQERGARGATTLAGKHVDISRHTVSLDFPGKSGRRQEAEFHDSKLAKAIRKCQDLPGQYLFTYLGDNQRAVAIQSSDVNDYLRSVADEPITAKDFRTWWGSVLALDHLASMPPNLSKRQRKAACREAVKITAKQLGNTVAVCRSSYIHPTILAAAESNELPGLLKSIQPVAEVAELTLAEARFAKMLPHLDFS